jgi:hypothetical protein
VPRKPGTLAFLQGNQQGTLGLNIPPQAAHFARSPTLLLRD